MEALYYLEKNFSLSKEENEQLEYLKIKSLFFQNNLTEALQKISNDDHELPENILILKKSILYSLKIAIQQNKKLKYNDTDLVLSEKIMQLLQLLQQNKSQNISSKLSEILNIARSGSLLLARENLLYLSYYLVNDDQNDLVDKFLKSVMTLYKKDPDFEIVYARYLINRNQLDQAGKIINNLPKETLEQTTNIYLKYNFYDLMANYYSRLDDFEHYEDILTKKQAEFEIIDKMQLSAKNKWFNIFEENLKNERQSLFSKLKNILLIISIISIASIILIQIRLYQIKIQIKKYGNFISKINLIKDKKTQPIPQAIPEKTENILLKKLEDFEKSDAFTYPDISLQSLAKKLETNTKYLSETINNHKQKNFNTYINELRITYIINKLKDDALYRKYKIKYLAEESGFTTHSAFAAVFKSFTGLSPINYIQLLKEKEE